MSNALESASLIMYPSGYSDGVLGSLKPTDGSGDFTFSRGSNLSATRVAPNGYIEKGYENLLLNSNLFDNGGVPPTIWSTINTSVTSGQSGYDGSSDAYLLSNNSTGGYLRQVISVSGVNTFSVYAKAGNSNWIALLGVGATAIYFDLQNGVSGIGSTINSIEPIGNDGWYRCSISTSASITQFRIYPADGDQVTSNTSSIYIQDAMLNQGLVAYPYVETTTAPVAGGILEDEPRIDFSDGCGHLLLEPSRTNAITHSEYITHTSNASITHNATTSPEGYDNAIALTENTAFAQHFSQQNLVTTGTYTFSAFFKANGRSEVLMYNGGSGSGRYFDLANGTLLGTFGTPLDSKIEDYGNGWYRCSITNNNANRGIIYLSQNESITYTGDGTSGVYIYGAQMEQDATYPTSYIPTYGSSQTRLADVCEASDVASLIGQPEGTLFFDFVRGYAAPSNTDNIGVSSSGGNRIGLFFTNNSNSAVISILDSSGFRNINFGLGFVTGERYKIALKYTSTQLKAYSNGTLFVTTDLFGFTETLNTFSLNLFNLPPQGQKYNQALLFPTALSDEECIALTS